MVVGRGKMSTSLTESVNKWLRIAQFWLLPGTCVLCRSASEREQDLCLACEARLPLVRQPCPRCGLPLPTPAAICGHCLRRPSPFASCVAPLAWAPPVDGLIAGFKYHAKLQHAAVLAPLLVAALRRHYAAPLPLEPSREGAARLPSLPQRLLPVPLHPARLRERGYNQSAELGRHLARALDLPLDLHSLQRRRATPAQRGLSAEARRRNLRGAFGLCTPAALAGVTRLALLDDVVTTMSTARELARLLRQAGVEEVHLWALARA